MIPKIKWPVGKDFAFTIFDDPDLDTVDNVAAIYSFLGDLGLRTTKAVWPIRGTGVPKIGGATCEDEQYLKWVLGLKEQGFEIALHNVTYNTSTREQTARGLEAFRRLFGHDPYSVANHSGCLESIYWGRERLSGRKQMIYDLACRDYRLQQEFIKPYTPEQNGIIERFFRGLKEECVWQHVFQTFDEARRVIRDWVQWYNQERPHQALGYRSPIQYRTQQAT